MKENKSIQGKASVLELILMASLGFYFIYKALSFDPVIWAQGFGRHAAFRRFLLKHSSPVVIQLVILLFGILFVIAVIWNIYKRMHRKY